MDASKASLIYATEPVFGGLVGWIAGEALGAADIAGGLLIVAGVILGAMPQTLPLPRILIAARGRFSARFGPRRTIDEQIIELP